MEKVYLLLRNNQQSGPFTIIELLKQQLRPSDMIWIEGTSTAWTYLSELELMPFAKKSTGTGQAPVAETSDEIERKAEELRQKVLTSTPKEGFLKQGVEIEKYSSAYKLPEEEIQFIDHRKEKKIKENAVVGELLLTCLVIGLFMIGIYKGKSFLGAKDRVYHTVATKLNSDDHHTARKITQPAHISLSFVDTVRKTDSLPAIEKPKQKIVLARKNSMDSLNTGLTQPAPALTKNLQEKKEETVTQPTLHATVENAPKKEDTTAKKEIKIEVASVKTTDEPVKEEKRGFLRGLFKRKHKERNAE